MKAAQKVNPVADPTFPTDPIDAAVDPEQWLTRYRQGPIQTALGALDDNPDDAAQAARIGPQIGVPPSVVHTDLEGYQQQHKAALTSALLDSNEHLRDYIASHPLAASISNDDWGQLDTISKKMDRFTPPRFRPITRMLGAGSVIEEAAKGFKEGFGQDEVEPFIHKWLGEGPIVDTLISVLDKNYALKAPRLMQGLLTGAAAGGAQLLGNLTGASEATKARLARDLLIWPQVAIPELGGVMIPPELQAIAKQAQATARKVEPWVEAGKRPPTTADPIAHTAAAEEAKLDAKNFDELYKEVQQSSTLPRDPEAFTAFGKIKFGDSTIGISADKIQELYGDARPTPDDGKLGWAPGIESQYDFALQSGADVHIPFADFLAKASPETVEAVRDGMRLRHGGLTLDEAKEPAPTMVREVAEGEPAPAPTALDTVRQSAGLVPEMHGTIARPAVPPMGVVPETSLLGAAHLPIEQRGRTILADASFKLRDGLATIQTDHLNEFQKQLSDFFGKTLSQLAGDTDVHLLSDVEFDDHAKKVGIKNPKKAGGFFDYKTGDIIIRTPEATGQLGYDNAVGILLHEGGHALTHQAIRERPVLYDLFDMMRKETVKHLEEIGDRETHDEIKYYLQNPDEYLAGGYENHAFREALAGIPVSEELKGLVDQAREGLGQGGVIRTMWDAFRQIISSVLQRLIGVPVEDSMLDAFLKMQEVFERPAEGVYDDIIPAAQRTPEDAALFQQAKVIGMNADRLAKHMELINKLREENAKFAKDQEILKAGEKATQEWKENLPRVQEEVKNDLLARPDIAADRFLRTGEFPNGQKFKKVVLKIDDPGLRKRLPPEYVGDKGVSPDSLANAFGYQSGRELVEGLARLENMRQIEGLTPAAQLRGMVDAETQRRMLRDYGRTAEQLLADTKEQAVSPAQMDLLHNELAALYEKNGQQPITQAALKAEAKYHFDRIPNHMHDSDRYLEAAGKEGNKFGEALLDGKPVEALQAKQKQTFLLHTAKLAMKLEKDLDKFDRLSGKYKKPEPTGVDPETATYTQIMLMNVLDQGFVQRSVQGLERQRSLLSPDAIKNFRDFVEKVNADHAVWNTDPNALLEPRLPIADFLLDGERIRISDMTPEQFNATYGALKLLDKYGRTLKKYITDRGTEDLQKVKDGLITRMSQAMGGKVIDVDKGSVLRQIGSMIINPESWFKRLDLGNRRGPFQQLLGRPIFAGQYDKMTMEKATAKRYRELGDFGDTREKIENDLFMDPATKFKTPMSLTKGNLYAILQNVGNELQRKKLAAGYGIDNPQKILDWLFQRTTKEDWQRAQKLGDIFSDLFSQSEEMRSQLYGWVPERIPLGEIQTPWGPMAEWYHPLIPDRVRHGALKAADMMSEDGYSRPLPSAGYTKQRTSANYPIQLNFNAIPAKLKEIINDIAMRPAITETSKIIFDKDFQNAFNRYYGPEYTTALKDWLRDSAGVGKSNQSAAAAAIDRAASAMRENMSTLLIGWNLGTVLKHFPTALAFSFRERPIGFLDSVAHMLWELPSGRERWGFAMKESEELQNRLRSMSESISATNQDLFKRYSWDHKFFTIRDAVQIAGAYPVAISDFISAVPLWDAEYRHWIGKGLDHGEAVDLANTAVRQTHGSSIISARAGIMRAGPLASTFMPFYNFFSNALQRNYEMAWKAKLAIQGRELSEMTNFEKETFERGLQHLPEILGGFLTYGVWVSLVEEIVDPMKSDEDDDPILWGAKVLARGPATMVPFVRDLVNAYLSGHEPSSGLMGTAFRDILAPVSGLEHDPDHKKTLRQWNAAAGALTGLTFETLGKVGQYTYNVSTGEEDEPDGMFDFYKVIRHGTTKERNK